MKRLIICIIVFNSLFLPVYACGPMYPFGDDVRFSILNPAIFGYADFGGFNYSANIYFDNDCTKANEESGRKMNVLLWKAYCKNKIDTASIYKAIYEDDDNEFFNNLMIRYFFQSKDTLAVNYLKFAKRCNDFNGWTEDPWERNDFTQIGIRTSLVNEALKIANSTKNKFIQQRYAFLAIRLAFYNVDKKTINSTYNRYFNLAKKYKNIVDYWALYFRAIIDTNQVEQNYYLALVFSNAPDKRYGVAQHYNQKIPLADILAFAKNSTEKTAVYLMHDLKNVGKGLVELQSLYQLKHNSRAFSFLLLREINKLEDWIYTPYYTYFQPSVELAGKYSKFNYDDANADYSKFALQHFEKDKLYANKLLEFIKTINSAKTENPKLVQTSIAYLQLMTDQYEVCLKTLKNVPANFQPAQLINILCLVTMQPTGNCKLPARFKSLIKQQGELSNNKFLFALARELEYKGNATEAALLYSKLNKEESWEGRVFWRTKKNHYTLQLDFYEDYFFYLDAEYTTSQMQALIKSIEEKQTENGDDFDKWVYSDISNNVSRLYDLLGTKYVRLNMLNEAYKSFKAVPDSIWRSDSYYYKDYLDANPFYTNFYAEHKTTDADTTDFTKTTIIATLINYLQKANNVTEKNRDYYYFLAANCYFNMTYYGNSWMMKRYYWTSNEGKSKLPDDKEYYQANFAREYYLKAKANAKTPQFAALCLRMAGRCEKYRLWNDASSTDDNRYYKELKDKFPDDFETLTSNCYSFNKYFSNRLSLK